ncbi:hypothetical protein BpJC7_26250 [Weizmannia acidilactici]|uniref:Uncharacterized protein n=1 Tax=Weizmannia acidilactici TaxID=2607726 RepID=A0A5J4J8V9_9BACI|nr:hypothetical protein [Weizmannia acidilactici]GER71322.1 hypothetical protein BpJC7_26250 [Weizmannia acidilactici]
MRNDLWRLEPGWLAGYTEDRELIRRIKRYKKDWRIMADYFKYDRLVGVQFKIPIEQRRSAKRMFGIAENKQKQAI